jgi:Uma2 family endonuclease
MTNLLIKTEHVPLTVDLSSVVPQAQMTEEQFYAFCLANRELRIERSATGEVIVMSPAFADTGHRNLRIAQQVANWADEDGTGLVFDSSAGFKLANGAIRSPDVAWMQLERWHQLSEAQKASFAPICPDFVVELRSASDSLDSLVEKMGEYRDNGVRLGFLIDPQQRQVQVYRPGELVQVLENPERVDCGPELPGFQLDMTRIW